MSKCCAFRLENYTGPVTSLLIVENVVICGCGSEVSIYNVSSFELQCRRQILHGATVHGTRIGPKLGNGYLLCVFGGKQVRVVLMKHFDDYITLDIEYEIIYAEDWIWDVQWLKEHEQEIDKCIALALAHNRVLKCKWQSGEVTESKECSEKCILYTACFIGHQWDNLVLAAGTVFNQVVLWPVANKVGQNLLTHNEVSDPILILSGHKGVIFSIHYHPHYQRICSVSDDRSIRMWQCAFPSATTIEPTIQDWESVQCSLLFSLYGHSARVWDVTLLNDCFISIAEDAICLVWDYKGNILKKFKGHKGRSIWSLAVSADEQYVLTGGGDASIRKWEIHQLQQKDTIHSVIPIAERCKEDNEDFPRSVQLLNFDTILIMMNSGKLYSYKVSDQNFQLLIHDKKFKSYSVLSPCPDDEATIAVGTISGSVRIIKFAEKDIIVSSDESFYAGKVYDIVWLKVHHILISGPEGNCLLLKVETHTDTKSGLALTVQHRIFLPSAKHRWITAACFVPSQNNNCRKTVVCGDKDGSILLYFLNKGSDLLDLIEPHEIFVRVHGKAGTTFVCYREGHVYSAGRDGFYRQWQIQNDTLVQLHGSKVVRGFEWIERLEWSQDDLLVYGFFSSQFVVWSINYNQQLMAAICGGGHRSWGCCHNDNFMRFVYLKAGSIYMVDRENLARQTIVKPPLHGREVCDVKFLHIIESNVSGLMHVVCSASEDNTINVGVFAKKNNVTCWEPLAAIKGHLSSVRAIAVSYKIQALQFVEKHHQTSIATDRNDKCDINFLIFTGGGRAEIRVWKLKLVHNISQDYLELKEKQTNHTNSAVESMSKVSIQDSKKKLISDHLYTFKYHFSHGRQLCPASISSGFECSYEHLSTHFLGESRHKKQHSTWKTQRLCLDPETRIMSLAATPLLQVVDIPSCIINVHRAEDFATYHILSTAGSDGYFRIFMFDERLKQFKLLIKSYYQGCVLKVIHYVHKTSTSNIFLAFSASTNGQIIIWDIGTILKNIVPSLKPNEMNASSNFASQNVQEDCESSISDDDHEDVYTDFNCESNNQNHTHVEDWKPYCILTANQSGINSLHTLQISETEFMLASGGDDNAICVQILALEKDTLRVVAKAIKTDAHAAQITGIWLVSSTLLISASIDQRINIWRIQYINGSCIEFQMLASKYMNIANATNMDVHLYGDAVYICIGGEGLCLYRFEEPLKTDHITEK